MNDSTRPDKPHWMLILTPLTFITGCKAFINGFYIIAFAEWILVLSSIIYWLKPSCETRRKFDMIIVQLSLYTHIIYSFISNSSGALIFYILGIISYLFGIQLDSNIMHSLVWILGNIGNYNLITDLVSQLLIPIVVIT